MSDLLHFIRNAADFETCIKRYQRYICSVYGKEVILWQAAIMKKGFFVTIAN